MTTDPLFPGAGGDFLFPQGSPTSTGSATPNIDFSGTGVGGGGTPNIDFSGAGTGGSAIPNIDFSGTGSGGGGVPNIDFSGSGSGGKGGGKPNLLHQVLGGAGKVVSAIGSIGGETIKEAGLLPYQLGESLVDKVAGTKFAPSSQFNATHPELAGKGLLPSQAEWTHELDQFPIAGGIVRGLATTGEELAHPSRIIKNYGANPVKAGLNDLGTIASLFPGVGEILKGLGGGADAANALTKAGTVVSKIGEAPSLPFRAARSGLTGLAENFAAKSELLHAVDEGLTAAGSAAAKGAPVAGDVAALDVERQAEIAKQATQKTGIRASLANAGARLSPDTQMAVNTAVSAESRLKAIMQNPASYLEAVEGKGAAARIEGLAPEAARGLLQKEVIADTTKTLLKNPTVKRISDTDLASLEAAADAAHTSVPRFVRSMGFTSLTEATNGLIKADTAFVPNGVADQLARVLETTKAPGVAGSILQGANRLAMVSKLALSPTTVINRIGHAVLGSATNPNIGKSARLAWAAARHKLEASDLSDLAANTTMVKHGAIWQAGLRTEAENPTRIQAITQSLMNVPSNLMERSPFLRAARAADDATRSGIWLAARHAGASPQEADLILGRTAGYFDRSTNLQRNISKAIPFYNWHKQVLLVFEHMAEERPAAFAQFVNAAARMADYNEQQGISGSNTRFGAHDINLSSVDPFSGVGAALRPQSLLSPVAKAIWPIVTGVGTSGYQTSSPTGPLVGGGAQQLPASMQELIKTLPQLQALQGSAPRYGTGDVRPGAQGGGALQTASRLFGLETTSVANNQIAQAAIKASADKNARIAASKGRKYQAKLSANGQTNSLFGNLP